MGRGKQWAGVRGRWKGAFHTNSPIENERQVGTNGVPG